MSTPEWVKDPQAYERLLADYAYVRLTARPKNAEDLKKVTLLTGRMICAGLDDVPLVHQLCYPEGWDAYHTPREFLEMQASMYARSQEVAHKLEQLVSRSLTKVPLTGYQISTLKNAMRITLWVHFLNIGYSNLRNTFWASRASRDLAIVLTRHKVAPPRDLKPWLTTICPTRRHYYTDGLDWLKILDGKDLY